MLNSFQANRHSAIPSRDATWLEADAVGEGEEARVGAECVEAGAQVDAGVEASIVAI